MWSAGRVGCKPSFVPTRRCLRVGDGHSSGRRIAAPLERYTRRDLDGPSTTSATRVASISPAFDLAPGGVYRPPMSPWAVRELLPHAFTVTSKAEAGRRSTLCGTFPEVTLAGRYPAPSPLGARTFLPRPAPGRLRAKERSASDHRPTRPARGALAGASDAVNQRVSKKSRPNGSRSWKRRATVPQAVPIVSERSARRRAGRIGGQGTARRSYGRPDPRVIDAPAGARRRRARCIMRIGGESSWPPDPAP